jgi:hypothetical protein
LDHNGSFENGRKWEYKIKVFQAFEACQEEHKFFTSGNSPDFQGFDTFPKRPKYFRSNLKGLGT